MKYLKCWKKNPHQPRILYPTKIPFKIEKHVDFLKQKPREFIASRTALQKMIKDCSSGRRKMIWDRNLDLHKERKHIGEGINEGKMKYLKGNCFSIEV